MEDDDQEETRNYQAIVALGMILVGIIIVAIVSVCL